MDIDRPPDIVIIAGGAPASSTLVASVTSGTRVVAADAGVAFAVAHGWSIDVAVGDFDSLEPRFVDALDDLAPDVRRYPVDKDATDLELALAVAVESVCEGSSPFRVLVVGVEGGRPDHALANLLLAAAERFAALDVEIALEHGRTWVVRDRLDGTFAAGALVSVIPVHGAATVSIDGVRWPLDRQTLEPGTTRGVSNEATGGPFRLTVHDGTALCIAPRTEEFNS